MRSRRAVAPPVAALTTGVVPAPASGSIPAVVVVVMVVGVETEYPPCGADDLLDPPHPEATSKIVAAKAVKSSLRMCAAYSGPVRETCSLLAQDLAERQAPQTQARGNGRQQRAEHGGHREAHEKEPRRRQVIGRRVEHVLEHRDEHLRQQPAEQGRKREAARKND